MLLFASLAALALMALVLFVAGLGEFAYVNHDTAFFLYSARKLAAGSRLYVDWYTVNPPPLFLVGMLCNAGAEALGISVVSIYHSFVLGLAAAGLWMTSRATEREDAATFGLVAVAYVGVAIAGNFAVRDFGQREHLFSLLFIPFLLWRLCRPRLSTGVVAVLVLLGFFSLMKPYFIALVFATELLARPVRRDGWPAWWALGAIAVGCAGVAALLAWHSIDSLTAFLFELMPRYLGGGYAYESDLGEFLAGAAHRWIIAGFALLTLNLVLAIRRGCVERPMAFALVAVPLLAYASVIHQFRFFSYPVAICFASLVVINAYLSGRLIASVPTETARRQLLLYPGLLLAAFVGAALSSSIRQFAGEQHSLAAMIRPLAPPDTRVMVFSPSLDFAVPALDLDLDVAGPRIIHTDVGSILRIRDDAQRSRALASYVRELAAGIDENRPALLFFSPSRQSLEGTTLHKLLVNEYRLLERGDYERIPSEALHRCCRDLHTWRVYRRVEPVE
jgi:hypothetical protein